MTYRIHNWDRWQSYRADRGQPPWIKVHRCLMRDEGWVSLTDAQRGHLISIWLLAADRRGVIPSSAKTIQKLCYLEQAPDLQLFIRLGFIDGDANVTPTWRQHDANMTPSRRQRDAPEAEAEAEAETEAEGGVAADATATPAADSPVFLELPGLGRKRHPITRRQVDEWQALYPAVDVPQQVRNMCAWLAANPDKRKVRVERFVVNWLNREQDHGGRNGSRASPSRPADPAKAAMPPVIEVDDELIEAMAPLLAELDCRDRRGRPLVDYGTTCQRIGSWLDEHGHRTSDELVQSVLVNWTRRKVAGSMEAQ